MKLTQNSYVLPLQVLYTLVLGDLNLFQIIDELLLLLQLFLQLLKLQLLFHYHIALQACMTF